MELITVIRKRCNRMCYVYGWRLRHWWLDTRAGRVAQLSFAGIGFLGLVGAVVRFAIEAATRQPGQPHEAIIGLIIWIIVAILAAVALSMSASKPAKPPDDQTNAPTTQDGRSAVRYYGTNWVDDPAMLAWKVVGRDPIKTKGGKK